MGIAAGVLTVGSLVVALAYVVLIGPWRPSLPIELRMVARELFPSGWGSVHSFIPSALLAAGLISGIAIEAEVRTGNARLIRSTGAQWFIVQKGSRDWINSSFLRVDLVEELNRIPGTRASGTERFFAWDGRDIFVVSFDGEASLFAPDVTKGRQAARATEVVVDEELDRAIGGEVNLGGRSYRIVGLTRGTSSLGKATIYVPETGVRKVTLSSTYTVIGVVGPRPESLIDDADVEVLTAAEFVAGNEGFWKRNGTTIVSSLVAAIVLLSTIGSAASKRTELLLARRSNAVLLAVGAHKRTLVSRELVKAGYRAVAGVAVGAPFTVVLLRMLNANVDGLAAEVEPTFVLWTLALMLLIPGAATAIVLSTVRGMRVARDLSEA